MLDPTYLSLQWSHGKLRSLCCQFFTPFSFTGNIGSIYKTLTHLSVVRTTGKFTYQLESSYSVGTVGYEDVDCDTIDHTYIRYVKVHFA